MNNRIELRPTIEPMSYPKSLWTNLPQGRKARRREIEWRKSLIRKEYQAYREQLIEGMEDGRPTETA